MTNSNDNKHRCECGSGISTKMCCDADIRPGSSIKTTPLIGELINRANSEFQQNNLRTVADYCIEILEQDCSHFEALRLLQRCHAGLGNHKPNFTLLARLNQLAMDHLGVTCDLALLQLEKGNLSQAHSLSRNAIRLAPDYAQSQNLMGLTLTKMNRLAAAEYHFREALRIGGHSPRLCANLALNLKRQGKLVSAEHYYLEALQLSPDNTTAILGIVDLYEVSKNPDSAWEWLKKIEKPHLNNPQIALSKAKLLERGKQYQSGLDTVGTLDDTSSPALWRQQGQLLDKLHRYTEAFSAHQKANDCAISQKQPGHQYNEKLATHLTQQLKTFFTKKRVDALPKIKHRTTNHAQPVFIIGFPRSGTTLTEQMLSSHKNINAGDELQFIHELAHIAPNLLGSDLPYPKCFADLWLGENLGALEAFQDYYLRKSEQIGLLENDAHWFTDKMPLNEMHLGLISLVFPISPVLHLIRHPLDVVLSTFFTELTHGFNCSYKLDTAAKHYMLVRDLVDHYQAALDINYRALRYEQLVQNPEQESRALLEWIGEPWDENCLNFHQNTRYARTASYAQVSEKLYTHSVFRYRHYLKELAPVIPILEPAIDQLGYTIDTPV